MSCEIKEQDKQYIESIIKIQSFYRGYIIRKKYIAPSIYQTGKWRKSQKWYQDGRHNECEIYQIKKVNFITKCKIKKTKIRLNTETFELLKNSRPLKNPNGFEWTEDFDGVLKYNKNLLYFNLKFVCSDGGAQTRSLREVYHFIKAQIGFLQTNKQNIHFINILDGNTSHKHINKYHYLLSKNKNVGNNIFCGDMATFNEYFLKHFKFNYTNKYFTIL